MTLKISLVLAHKKLLAVALAVAGLVVLGPAGHVQAAPINPVSYGSLDVTGMIDFESLSPGPLPGLSIDGVLDLEGASFAEHFSGQSFGTSGNFDTLAGSPSGPLTLVSGAVGENIVAADLGGVGIGGLGPLGFPSLSANGEGALAILFDIDTHQFGIEIRGGDGGNARFDFFQRDGTLIESVTLSGVTSGLFGFERDLGLIDIAGVTVTNDDIEGFGMDNVRFLQVVPEPSSAMLIGLGLGWLGRSRGRSIETRA